MQFNWIIGTEADEKLQRFCIELEYQLRPKITKFLISRIDSECCTDFSCFHFDIDLSASRVTVSERTPYHFFKKIKSDFDREIGLYSH